MSVHLVIQLYIIDEISCSLRAYANVVTLQFYILDIRRELLVKFMRQDVVLTKQPRTLEYARITNALLKAHEPR